MGGKNEVSSSGSFGQMVPNALVPNGTKQEEGGGQKMAVTSESDREDKGKIRRKKVRVD